MDVVDCGTPKAARFSLVMDFFGLLLSTAIIQQLSILEQQSARV